MTKHIERLMSRASVPAMVAFAPDDPPASLPSFAERVEDTGAGSGGPSPIDGLTAEEQAQVDAMANAGQAESSEVDHSGDDAPADGDDGDEGDGEQEPAAADRDAPADGAARPKPKTISYGRHQKELAKLEKARSDLQAQLDGARQETTKEREARLRLDERSRLLFEAINARPAAAAAQAPVDDDPEPNEDDDPLGHSKWKIRKLEKTVNELAGGQQRQQQATAAENEDRQVYESLVGDIQRVVAGDPARGIEPDPTMTDAFVHLRETRYQELGFIFADIDINDAAQCATLSPADQKALSDNIQRTFHNEQMLVAKQSMASGKSPAAVIRNLARARGWKPGAAAPAAPAPSAPAGRVPAAPAARAPAAPASPAGSVKDQLNAVRDNLEASRSLSDAGGSPGGQMTPERLASMSDAEFQSYYNSMPKEALDRVMGKPANM